jgi:hypothetical protein
MTGALWEDSLGAKSSPRPKFNPTAHCESKENPGQVAAAGRGSWNGENCEVTLHRKFKPTPGSQLPLGASAASRAPNAYVKALA